MIRSRILQLLISIQVVQYGTSTGKLGCLFSSDLCKSTEFCFNDALFGTCQDVYEEANLFRYQLDKTGLQQLEREIRQLILNGYKWDDSYTQCVLQTLLHSIKWQLNYNRDFCSDISPKLALDFLKYLQEYATQDASDIVTTFPPSPIWAGEEEEDRFRKYKKNNEELTEDELNNLLLSLQTFEESQNDHQESRQNTVPALFEPDATADREKTLIGDDDDKDSQLMFTDNGRQINLDEVSELLSAIQSGLTDSGDEVEALGKGAQEEEDALVEEAELRNKKEWIHFPGDSNDVPKKDGLARPEVTHLIQSHNQPSSTPPQLVTSVFIMKKANYPAAIDLMVTSMPEIDPNADPRNYDVVDTKYTYIKLADKLTDHKGRDFVRLLEKLLKLTAGTFTDIKVDGDQVTFLINPNSQNLNGSAIAALAMSHKEELEKMGFTPISAGVGKETTISVVEADDNSRFFVVTFVFCGCIAAGLLAVVVLYVVRRHARSQAKLQNLTGDNDAEAGKDYQDLCRQRMACKSSEKPEPVHVAQRVGSLSQSEASVGSPSSRSSTSSWGEEPAVSNMDISTGHMVLAYMEDHLKTKDRLEQEWAALCAYEAEPCSISIGSLPENKDKNRFPELLPYDHSRVILNNTSNASGLDYINANTIADHDPRNPAYIATQGTLPNTIADFWQMVWEQGSVVIVMLSRLTENGVAMCHRYWPEEGSELSHIYEIHLVSEHIWCDDYLVRSFYLKNLKTNETRTVTQFHFLSWPEMGVPASPKALLDFRRKVNKSYRGRSCPIVVHCSDGAGRTGTYCLIDMVLSRMTKGAKEIDIAATLEHIRDQRAGMVRTKEQFEFVLMAVAEEVHAILKALPQ